MVVSPLTLEKLLPLVGLLFVLPPWIWLAVRTEHCLLVITSGTIPFPRRTIWLAKTLALIVGAGGLLGAVAQLRVPWFLAISSAVVVVFFALRENVHEIIPPRPNREASAYQLAWQHYRHLRSDYMKSWKWFIGTSTLLIVLTAFADKLPKSVLVVLFAFCLVAVLASIGIMNIKQLKWLRWPCPRCGCAFRGFWWRPWMPKHCVYCGLERRGDDANQVPVSTP